MGLSEAAVDESIAEFFGRENPYLGIYSKADGIHLMIARARDVSTAQAMIQPVEEAIVTRLAMYVWGYDDDTPEQAAGKILTERGLTLATMENCTGGYLVNSITEVPDSAAYFKGGVVAYSQEMHLANGVPLEVMQQHGTVSQASATAMAQAIRAQLGADFGIGVTGVPGPLAVEGKPVGLAYFSIASASTVHEQECAFPTTDYHEASGIKYRPDRSASCCEAKHVDWLVKRVEALLDDLHRFALDQLPVDVIPQTWLFRSIDQALIVHLNVLYQRKFIRPTGRKHLIVITVRHGHRDMQVGDVVERVAAVVDLALHVKCLGQMGNFHQRGDATSHGHIATQDIAGHLLDPLGHAIETAGRIFSGHDGDVQFISELNVAIQVFFRERIFVPEVV